MDRYIIIADDFTGANDTGVQFKRRGFMTKVTLKSDGVKNDGCCYVIDSESRSLTPDEAFTKVKSLVEPISLNSFNCIIKKVDSTLRGNIAEEIKAVDDVYKSELIIFMPALPDLKRTTKNGVHYLDGIRITDTELAADPKTPVKEDSICALMEKVYTEPVALIKENDALDFRFGRIFCCDAETNGRMREIISAALETKKRVLFVGTAAIADNLLDITAPTNPAMGLIASVSDITRKQVEMAKAAGIKTIEVSIGELISGKNPSIYTAQAIKSLTEGNDTLIISDATTDRSNIKKSYEAGEKIGLSNLEVSNLAQKIMGKLASDILNSVKVSGLFVSGGDTAIGFFDEIGAIGTQIADEVLPGIPLMYLEGGKLDGLKVISKAGAFGDANALIFCLRKLKEQCLKK